MVARADALVEHVRSGDQGLRLKAVREMKNQVVGSRAKKLQMLKAGAVPHLLALLAADGTDPGLVVQATTTVGSLAYKLEDGVLAVLTAGGLPQLLRQLSCEDERIVEAAVRCLHFLLQSDGVSRADFCDDATVARLVQLLAAPRRSVAQAAASVLAQTCGATPQRQTAAADAGAVSALMSMVQSGQRGQQEAAVAALASLADGNAHVAAVIAAVEGAAPALQALLRDRDPGIRLLAAACLVQLLRYDHVPSNNQAVPRTVLAALVRALQEQSASAEDEAMQREAALLVPRLFAVLLTARPELQPLAADTDAVTHLCLQYTAQSPAQMSHKQQQESVLQALAVVMAQQEPARVKFMDANMMPPIIAALGLGMAEGVQASAADCARALSRSAKGLRMRMAEAPVAAPLVALLRSATHPNVQAAAASALCNLVLDFSPVKDAVLQAGGLEQMVAASAAMEPVLRCNGVWAMQNLAHTAALPVKHALLAALPLPAASVLLSDPEPDVQEHTLTLLRNLVHGGADHARAVMTWAADEGNPGSGAANLLAALAAPLQPGAASTPGQKEQALFAVCNVCAGEEELQQAVMASAVPGTLIAHLAAEEDNVREAAAWCVVNLSSSDTDSQPLQWVPELTRMGVSSVLARMENDPSQNVRRTAATAMAQFAKPEAEAMACDDD